MGELSERKLKQDVVDFILAYFAVFGYNEEVSQQKESLFQALKKVRQDRIKEQMRKAVKRHKDKKKKGTEGEASDEAPRQGRVRLRRASRSQEE